MRRAVAIGLPARSVRNVVHTSVGGVAARIRLTDRFGTGAQAFGHVTVAVRARGENGPDAVPGTVRDVRFHGSTRVSVPAGARTR